MTFDLEHVLQQPFVSVYRVHFNVKLKQIYIMYLLTLKQVYGTATLTVIQFIKL